MPSVLILFIYQHNWKNTSENRNVRERNVKSVFRAFLTKRPICTENNEEPSNSFLFIFKTCCRHSRFFIDDNDFPELDFNKTFYYIHIKEIPGGLSSENIYQNEVREFFFRLLTQLHKLRSQLRGSFFIWFHFRSCHIWFISYTFAKTWYLHMCK